MYFKPVGIWILEEVERELPGIESNVGKAEKQENDKLLPGTAKKSLLIGVDMKGIGKVKCSCD